MNTLPGNIFVYIFIVRYNWFIRIMRLWRGMWGDTWTQPPNGTNANGILKSDRFVPLGTNLVKFGPTSASPVTSHIRKDVNFGIQIGSDFGCPSQNVLKFILKSPRFVPFGTNLTQFGCQFRHHIQIDWQNIEHWSIQIHTGSPN